MNKIRLEINTIEETLPYLEGISVIAGKYIREYMNDREPGTDEILSWELDLEHTSTEKLVIQAFHEVHEDVNLIVLHTAIRNLEEDGSN